MNLRKEKKVAILAAKRASKVMLEYWNKKREYKLKDNNSFVTTADLEANKVIINTIKQNFPSHSILSEETGLLDNNSDFKWVIDPIDGTHNFIHGIPFFGTSIAIEYKSEVVIGVIDFPLLELTAIAEKGKGAFLNTKRIKVSDTKSLELAYIMIEFSNTGRKRKIDFLNKILPKAADFRDFGSAVYHLLLIACGKADCYTIFATNEWDVAAGFLIVEEAGGKITDLKGKKWNFRDRQYVVSNGRIHKKILSYTRK